MMDRQKGKLVFECDGCGDVFTTTTGDFELAQALRSEEGWVARRAPDELNKWEHFCPKCK